MKFRVARTGSDSEETPDNESQTIYEGNCHEAINKDT